MRRRQGAEDALEQSAAVGAALQRLDQVFRVGHHAEDVAPLVEDAGDVVERAVGIGGSLVRPCRRRSGRRCGLRLERGERVVVAAVVAVAMRDRAADDLALAVAARENRVWQVSTRSRTSRQMKCRLALRMSTPGSRPASQRIWKPLQMPSTATPAAARSATARMTGERAAIAPERR